MLKRKVLLLTVLIASLAIATASWAAPKQDKAKDLYKQIAAPAEDFALLALPNPAESGTNSHSAMIPVTLNEDSNGQWTWTGKLPLDSGHGVSIMVLAPEAGAWDLAVTTNDGKSYDLSNALESLPSARQEMTSFGLGAEQFEAEVFTVERMRYGLVDVTLTADKGGEGFVVFANESGYQQYTHLSSHSLLVGNQVGLVTYAYVGEKGEVLPTAVKNSVAQATAYVTTPAGAEVALAMYDDGLHADGLANDGVFGTLVDLDAAGNYIARVEIAGQTAEGRAFLRTSQTTFPAIEQPFTLADKTVTATHTDSHLIFQIPLAKPFSIVDIDGGSPAVKVAGEVWARNAQGEMVAVSWIGGMAQPQYDTNGYGVRMLVDGRWLALADAHADIELRNVRIQDVATSIPVVTADRLEIAYTEGLPQNAYSAVESISEDMLMGERPAALANAGNSEAGAGLVLSHGYCAGSNNWPSSHFTGEAKFVDANQNRTHDEFARRIRDFGNAQFDSHGLVAHSQGGAASLHLYTYYWSGLDSSSGNRLIQSVGTPYQGTALAGNLAAIGEIFGIQCGTNFDLTYDGASLWLSGIPSWARSRVYYHTTSFKDRWWAYDYCNIATDLFLSDPDDGVIEKSKGQLSGANNLGHKTNQCHTGDMRDPDQKQDSNRNANMNANANR